MQVVEEIARHFHNQGYGTLGTNLFYGHLPDNAQSVNILVRDTGGTTPDQYVTSIKSPTFQVFITSTTYDTGKTKLESIRDDLHTRLNKVLIPGGITYRYIKAIAEGGHLGKNDAGLHEFSINFQANILEP